MKLIGRIDDREIRVVARVAMVTIVALALAGCSMVGQGGAKEQLTKALEAHSESVRWGGSRGSRTRASASPITKFAR